MAGVLDFILAQQGRKDVERRRDEDQEAIRDALGRAPGVGPFRPGEGGSGLLADPTDPTNQARFAGQLAQVAPQSGSQLLSGIFGNVQSGENVGAAQGGANLRQQLGNEQSDVNSRRGAFTSLTIAAMNAEVSRANSLDRLAGANQGSGIPGVDFGPVGTGMVRTMGANGFPQDIGIPGSTVHSAAREQLRGAQQSVGTVFSIEELIKDEGFDFTGTHRASFDFLRTSLQGELTEMLNLGVINSPAEMERLLELAPDQSAFTNIATLGLGTVKSSVLAKYGLLRQLMQSKYDEFATRYQTWPGMDDLLPQQQQAAQ